MFTDSRADKAVADLQHWGQLTPGGGRVTETADVIQLVFVFSISESAGGRVCVGCLLRVATRPVKVLSRRENMQWIG